MRVSRWRSEAFGELSRASRPIKPIELFAARSCYSYLLAAVAGIASREVSAMGVAGTRSLGDEVSNLSATFSHVYVSHIAKAAVLDSRIWRSARKHICGT